MFDISATDNVGVFDVNAKFMGVSMDKYELVFQVRTEALPLFEGVLNVVSTISCLQDLLQLQYEGVAVMRLFDRARVNVNLLVFLINKKFYGK